MVVNLELLGPMVLVPGRRQLKLKFDKLEPAVKINFKLKFQVTQIVRFLLERGLRFRNLGVCGHNLM